MRFYQVNIFIRNYFLPKLVPWPVPVAPAWPVNTFSNALPEPEAVPTPPFWAEVTATPEAETPPGPALPVPAPAADPLPPFQIKIQTK